MTTMIDYRRQDQMRTLWTPYWIVSSEVSAVDSDDLAAIVFSFPAAKYGNSLIQILDCAIQVTTIMAGGTIVCELGSYTLATDAVTTGGDATIVDIDDYVGSADVTYGTAGFYWAAGSDWLTARAANANTVEIITPADATVPAVAITITSDAAITAGKCRAFMRICEVPKL